MNIFQINPQLLQWLQQFDLLPFDFNSAPFATGQESGEEGHSEYGEGRGEHGEEGLVFDLDGRGDSDPTGHHSRESEGRGHDSDGPREADNDAGHASDNDRDFDPAGHHSEGNEGFGHDNDIDGDGDYDAGHTGDYDAGDLHMTSDMDYFIA